MSDNTETIRPAFAGRERPLLSYGIPFPDAAAQNVEKKFGASRVCILCSKSLAQNTNALGRLILALGPNKVVGQRIGMKSHTFWSEVLEIVDEGRRLGVDLLITLGAGSLTDAAKIVALAIENDIHTPEELETLAEGSNKRSHIAPPTIPIISIPTSLSGGEYSNFAGGTDDRSHRKFSFQPPCRGPEVIILDPELAQTTPDWVWLSTGVRAVDHCVEALCAISDTTPSSDELAKHALGLLVPGLLKCKKNHNDQEAYLQCQLGSVDAMASATGGIKLGASHGIGHQLGPLGVGHGETSCILLPAVCKFNAKYNANQDRQSLVREFLVRDPIILQVLNERSVNVDASDLGDVLDAVVRELGMPRSLSDVHVSPDKIDSLAAHSLHDRWCKSNPVPLERKEQVIEILEMVL